MMSNKKRTSGLNDLINFVASKIGNIIVAEIGSFEGISTVEFCKHKSVKHVYSIDPYLNGYDDTDKSSLANMIKVENTFIKNTKPYSSKLTKIKKKSIDSIDDIVYANMIYIDACHTYEGCKSDINTWVNKVLGTGFLTGHDYSKNAPGIIIAINEFLNEYNIKKDMLSLYKDRSWCIDVRNVYPTKL